ncbi:MAG: hypothetical protein K2G19_04415, partial [Lachnospiraceae bacterium]|nr:hypothetical protein [Lachnospiraceae bacterium]
INTGIKAPVYVFALKEINIKKLFQWMLAVLIAVTVGIMAASLFWDFGKRSIEDYREGFLFLGTRYSLGFAHPNVLQFLMFSMLSYCLVLYGERMSLLQYVILGTGYAALFGVTYSRTGFIVGGLILVLAVLFRFCGLQRYSRGLLTAYVLLITLFFVFSIAVAAEVRGIRMIEIVDDMIGGRVSQLDIHMGDMDSALPCISNWRLFSSHINKNMYDMGYVQIFYYYGIIPAICYFVFLFYAFGRGVARKDRFGCLVLAGFSIYLFTESLYFSNYLTRDFMLMGAAAVWYGAEHLQAAEGKGYSDEHAEEDISGAI